MISEIQYVIAEELRAAENRIWTRLEPLFEEKREDEFEGTYKHSANLFIP